MTLEPQGVPAVLDGSLDQGNALLAWPNATAPRPVVAANHHTPPAKAQAPPPADRREPSKRSL